VNQDMEALNRHLRLGLHPLSLCTMQLWPNSKPETMSSEGDFCRMMSLQLAAERIVVKNKPGAIAEVGVYRGEFAAVSISCSRIGHFISLTRSKDFQKTIF
jgi:hypothetical protein